MPQLQLVACMGQWWTCLFVVMKEVEECCKRAMKRKRRTRSSMKMKSDEQTEPEWVEVVVDVLLSMLSQGNKLTRAIVDNVFCLVCPHLTEQALQQILDVSSNGYSDLFKLRWSFTEQRFELTKLWMFSGFGLELRGWSTRRWKWRGRWR